MICKYGEVCSSFYPCEYHAKEEKLKLREREVATSYFTPRVIIHEPIVRREVVYEDSSPGLTALAAGVGGLLGSWLGSRNSNEEINVTPRRKALPAHKKNRK